MACGLRRAFHPHLTGAQNTRFVARVHGIDTAELEDYVQGFSELGTHFHMPFRTYSQGMRARLSFGVSMGVAFDTYLVDEITAAGDAGFRRKSRAVFADRLQQSGAIIVNHNLGELRELCTAGLVLENGRLQYFQYLEGAIAVHKANLA